MAISDGIGNENANRMLLLSGGRSDGNIVVLFSGGKLELKADFYPPQPGGRPLDTEQITAALARAEVIHGILRENIEKAAKECNLNRRLLRDIAVARGNPPIAEVLEYFQVNPKLKPAEIIPLENERIDYRSISPFVIVKKGQALAKRKSRKEGRNGRDIYGQEIPHGTIRPDGVSAGINTHSDGIFIYSDINGQLVADKGVLNVQETLIIKGAVNYRTGNIIFPGDVFIEGPVSDGFKIYSGGSVTIKQTFDVTEAITKTDLIVSGGIIGRGKALLKVGGELRSKFLDNCKTACRKTVTVDAEIVNSSVYTMEKVEMTDKGMILGSEIYAVHGVRTGGIGKKTGKSSRIHCGVDFTAQQEQEKLNNQLKVVSFKLKKLRELLAAEGAENPEPASPGAERRRQMEDTLAQLEEEQRQTAAKASAVLARLNADEDAVIESSGIIMAGTLIEICQVALFVSEPLKHVRIRLDRSKGKLVTEKL
ncbi:MAG: FapA family protein [Treponema sp.]|nr:FapA family protein [Treponema sp.]